MAVQKTPKTSALKAVSLHENEHGELKEKAKTYNNVKTDATDQAVFNTYGHITRLQKAIPEQCLRVNVDLLTEE